jgi:single-stranded-DNA-specific exonuclease
MNWVIKQNNDNESVKRLSNELNISPILSSMLVNRRVKTFDEAKKFFRPNFEMLHDPFFNEGHEPCCRKNSKSYSEKRIYNDFWGL